MNDSTTDDSVRLDRWLWAARFFKTRTLAAKAVGGGKVKLNGRRVKRSASLRIDDRVRVQKGHIEYEVIVRGLSERRGPAREAVKLYEETAESVRTRELRAAQARAMPDLTYRGKGRPTKKERRQIDRLKGYRKR